MHLTAPLWTTVPRLRRAQHRARPGTSSAPTANKLLLSDANGNWEYVATSSLGITGGGGGSSSQWTTSGSNIYFNTGNVRIGTTTPTQALTVSGNGQFTGTLTVGSPEDPNTGLLATDTPRFVAGYAVPPNEGYDELFQFKGTLGDSLGGGGWEPLEATFQFAPETDGQSNFGSNFNSFVANTKHITENDAVVGQAFVNTAATVDLNQGIVGNAANYFGSTVGDNRAFSAYTGASGNTTGTSTSYYASTPTDVENITNNYGIWTGDQTGATCSYAFWYDSPGVFRIKNDGVMAYYNPNFTKYTPCGTNYERVVQEWNNNVAEYGTENGGTGQAVPLAFITASTTRMTIGATGNVGIGTTNPYSRLQVTGADSASSTSAFAVVSSASTTVFAVFDGGNAQLSGTLTQSSDQRLKTNIQSLDASSSLIAIDALSPVTFNWIDPNAGSGTQVGFIAQDVQKIFPQLVATTSATALTPGGTPGLNYIGLISPIVSAIQALSSEVQNLITEVQGFAQSFTSNTITATNQLCVSNGPGDTSPVCVTKAQLAALLASANGSNSTATGSSSNQSQSGPQQSPAATSSLPKSVTQNSASTTPPTITINGDDPATIQVGDSYADLGATVSDTGTGQAGDTNLGYKTFLNGTLVSNIIIDTNQVATDTIDYVATDNAGFMATSTRTVIIEAVATSAAQ